MNLKNTNGAVLYRGPSLLDGSPIVVIATGLDSASGNGKTGDMIQTWILRDDVSPTEAVKSGADSSICGDCPHRGTAGRERTCYVVVFQAPLNVWKTFHRGRYLEALPVDATKGRMVRIGSYGDPAAVPVAVWEDLTRGSLAWTGYTHQWRNCDPALARFCMASCDTVGDRAAAKLTGWRTFRVSLAVAGDTAKREGEVVCPASKEAGVKLDCAACKACNGTASGKRGDVTIQAHGGVAVMSNLAKLNLRLVA
jgi:hypothetical protein